MTDLEDPQYPQGDYRLEHGFLLRCYRLVKLALHRAIRLNTTSIDDVRVYTGAEFCPRHIHDALVRGHYEYSERVLLRQILKPYHRVLDIGAGIGLTSILARKLLHEDTVLSYEANPIMRSTIEANFRLNGLVPRLRMKAIVADGTLVQLYRNDNVTSSSVFYRDLGAKPILVESDGINDVIEEHRPNVVIMDVEGAESDLIPVAKLDDVEYLLVEFHPHVIGQERINCLVSMLEAAGLLQSFTCGKNSVFQRDRVARHL